MRSAVQQNVVPARATTTTSAAVVDRANSAPAREVSPKRESTRRVPPDRQQQLELSIRQRIESRLGGRMRNLVVRVSGDTVVLEGQCATYYTKQLAQHAALGVLEDEHLENAIIVSVSR